MGSRKTLLTVFNARNSAIIAQGQNQLAKTARLSSVGGAAAIQNPITGTKINSVDKNPQRNAYGSPISDSTTATSRPKLILIASCVSKYRLTRQPISSKALVVIDR